MVAMSIQSLRPKFPTLFLMLKYKELLIALYFILFILGLNLGIGAKFYNEFRIIEIVLLLGLGFYSIFHNKSSLSKAELAFFAFLGVGYFFWSHYFFMIVDLLVAYLLYKSFYALDYNKIVTKVIILFSFLIFLLFPVALIEYITSGFYDPIWYPMPWNIRIYNSYFFIVAILATWCYLTEHRYRYVYAAFLWLAFLSILLDAGRSATLAYSVFVIILIILNRSSRWQLLAIYGLSWISYLLLTYVSALSISNPTVELPIGRLTTSLRYDLWVNAYRCWVQNPLIGCGFYQPDTNMALAAHPHNLFIQVISEIGIVGLVFLLILIIAIIKNISWNLKQNYFVIAALIGVSIDMSLSGAHIYPITQIALLWLFIFLLKNPEFSHSLNFNQLLIDHKSSYSKFINMLLYIMISMIFLYVFTTTTMLEGSQEFTPPRFWEYGYQLL